MGRSITSQSKVNRKRRSNSKRRLAKLKLSLNAVLTELINYNKLRINRRLESLQTKAIQALLDTISLRQFPNFAEGGAQLTRLRKPVTVSKTYDGKVINRVVGPDEHMIAGYVVGHFAKHLESQTDCLPRIKEKWADDIDDKHWPLYPEDQARCLEWIFSKLVSKIDRKAEEELSDFCFTISEAAETLGVTKGQICRLAGSSILLDNKKQRTARRISAKSVRKLADKRSHNTFIRRQSPDRPVISS